MFNSNSNPDQGKPALTGQRLRSIAFALLAKREYSKHDLSQKLVELGGNLEEITALVDELAQDNYQSDERMAGMLVRHHVRQGRGPARLKQALKKHTIEHELADAELDKVDWFQQALQLKIKKFGSEMATEAKIKAKQIRFLQYRGFDMDVIMRVMRTSENDIDDFL